MSQGASASRCAVTWAQAERRPFTEPIEIPGVASGGERVAFREDEDQDASTNTCLSSPKYTLSKTSKTMLRTELQEQEFQEADILWPDAADLEELLPGAYFSHTGIDDGSGEYSGEHQPPLKLQVGQKASSPIDIPGRKVVGAVGAKGTAGFSKFGASHAGASVVIGSHVFVPPHVIVDRRAKRDKKMMMLVVPSGRARARKMREYGSGSSGERANRSTAMASAEELFESEVMWPEAPHDDDAPPSCSAPSVAPGSRTPARRGVSRPVDIPRTASSARRSDDDDGGRSGTMVPPHVLVSRRRSSERAAVAFALRSGPGRARELSHLRNSVLRMTGFIEG
ncbi:hypothetical protein BAE44_0010617 [Dichanthelium oligosanthes]|uniref:Uncharacterized protein n=1 Tax=Dichanthelium oligosanthes TaxID=888268 RepID=A0A1E5VTD3_9POAL|nr:hypothetical protein BAE44_0010617 [Dichanthelium oligosanthes]